MVNYVTEYFNPFFNTTTKVTYPPYNILKKNEDEYILEMACAGFSRDELSVTVEKERYQNFVVISGKGKEKKLRKDCSYIHKGIAQREFFLKYLISDDFEVSYSEFADGMLYVFLKKKPEAQPRKKEIEIH